jgi:hypothetical protein
VQRFAQICQSSSPLQSDYSSQPLYGSHPNSVSAEQRWVQRFAQICQSSSPLQSDGG